MLLAIYFAVGALAVACSGSAQANCVDNECATVRATVVCMNCQAGHVPVDGNCVAKATNDDDITAAGCTKSDGGTADQTCGKCGANYFLFQGGCYKVGKEPGSLVCTDALGSNTDKPGVCKACAEGYFRNTQADSDSTQDSCKACQDANCATCQDASAIGKCTKCAEGYFVGAANSDPGACVSCGDAVTGSNGFRGVDGCAKCTKPDDSSSPATCTECNTNYLKTESAGATSCVTADKCGEGFFATTVGSVKKCVSCSDNSNGVVGCEKCTAPGEGKNKPTCTKCTGENYLKTAADGTTTCETTCPEGYFGHTATGGLKTCQSCATEATLNPAVTGIPGCTQCTYAAARANTLKCTACGFGYKLEGGACVSSSTNKSGLSTGVIAGIAAAIIAVVGGLVGLFSHRKEDAPLGSACAAGSVALSRSRPRPPPTRRCRRPAGGRTYGQSALWRPRSCITARHGYPRLWRFHTLIERSA
ncbi:Variant-specific surface protein [Giardia duodenalis]|uniref:Variant-specific surface protein n=1 Tax=Giardia intestinalis TaxID=5741 RepID=V6TNW5_GIAIN|nr:Variant-specific surface protein [Giardia intestinalis]